ncbi:MAG: thiolase family protein [Lautropia sp.]
MSLLVREKEVAITGIGQSECGRPSSRSPLELAADACLEAIADAGLTRDDIDGIATFPGEVSDRSGFSPVGIQGVRAALRLRTNWHAAINRESSGQIGCVMAAIAAIIAGYARHVLVFRSVAEASAFRKGRDAWTMRASIATGHGAPRVGGAWSWMIPYHAVSAATWFGLHARYHMDVFGLRPEQLAQIALTSRRNARMNANAIYRDPLSIEEYLASRVISDPLRLYDCDVPIDGCTALVLSRRERARGLRNPPIRIEAVGTALKQHDTWMRPESFEVPLGTDAARMMWNRTDLKPSDVDVAQLYDGFSILTLEWLESLGFCGRGESGFFVEGGSRIALEGTLPLNTGGGQLSAGRWHGLGHLHEACVQLWGRGGLRQVAGEPRIAVVSNGAASFVGCMLVARE